MNFFKKIFNKIKNIFYTPDAPIGLIAIGINGNCLKKICKFNFSKNRFNNKIISPVNDPYLIKFYNNYGLKN